MKKQALKKDFRSEVKKSRNRFLSIFFIVALGVAFFAGIHASAPDMRATGDYYFDQGKLMDLRVISTLGLTEADVKAMEELEGVQAVYGSYTEDVYCQEPDSQEVLHFEALQDGVNELTVKDGRLPKQPGECFLDADYAAEFGYEVGDTLEIQVESEDSSTLKRRSYVVSGCGYSPAYVSFMRGSTTLGTGSLSGFAYVLPEDFDSEVYSVAYLHVTGAREAVEFTDEYDELVDAVYDRLDEISDLRCEVRYDEVMGEAESELEEARQEIEDGKQELEDAKKELADGKAEAESELEEAESELIQGESELADGEQELADAKKELEDGQKELEDGQREIDENAQTLADAKNQIADGQKKLRDGEEEYAAGLKEFNETAPDARKKLVEAQKQIDQGKKQLEDGWKEYEKNLQVIEDGETQLEAAEKELEAGQAAYDAAYDKSKAELDAGKAAYESGKAELEAGKSAYEAGAKEFAAGKAEYEQRASEFAAGKAAYEKAIADLAAGKAAYEAGAAELEEGKAAWEAGMEEWNTQKAQYDAGRAQLDDSWKSYNEDKSALNGNFAALTEEETQVQNLKVVYDSAENKVTQLQQEADELERKISQLQAEIDALKKEQETFQNQEAKEETEKQSADSLLTEKEAALAEARNNLSSKEAELVKAQEERNAVKTSWESAAAALAEKRATLEVQSAQLAQIKQGLNTEEAKMTEEEAALDAGKTALDENKIEIETSEATLAITKQQLEEGEKTLAASKEEIDAGEAALAAAGQDIAEGEAKLAATKQQLDQAEAELTTAKQQIDAGYAQLQAAGDELSAGRKEINAKKKELAEGRKQLEAAKVQMEASAKELEAGQKEVDDGYAELEKGEKQLKSARKELDLGWAELNASQKQITSGEKQLADAREQLSDAREELADGMRQIEEAEEEIAENKIKIKDGWEEYEEGKKEAEEEIADGEQKIADAEEDILEAEEKIADAEEELADIQFTKWYIDDRSVLPEHMGFGENADRLTNIAKVFPLLFFLVAALISLTTMTRMVEEERTQIGTLKALGYSEADIASKYLKYAFFATMGGSIFGVLFGEKVFPWVIITAYGTMYTYLPRILLPYNWEFGLTATGAALLCTMGATLSACFKALRTVPAQLMRPPAPKAGKRVLLEYVPFIWHSLNFTWKSTIRNLLRYKKRFLMTIIGIGGCMGLLLVGYGLKDSIMDIAVLQYKELQRYDAMVVLDTDVAQREINLVQEAVERDERISHYKNFYMQSENVENLDDKPGKEWSVYLYVPEDLEDISDFLYFRDRETHEEYTLTDEGAILTEKLAKEFDIQPGDSITLSREDGDPVTIPVAQVCENYMAHYLYLTPTLYEQVYGEAPEYNSIFFTSEESQEVIEDIGKNLLENDAVLNITYTRNLEGQIDDMLGALNSVMIVFIAAAGALAFVVLYNLNNININERRRELATLKVLGFYDGEVSAYVYRENILLTVIGAGLGCFIGKVLHMFVIVTVEVDACMFGRLIKPRSFLIGTLFTFAFSIIVNFVMHFKLKKIDMVESLKSIE